MVILIRWQEKPGIIGLNFNINATQYLEQNRELVKKVKDAVDDVTHSKEFIVILRGIDGIHEFLDQIDLFLNQIQIFLSFKFD